MALNRRLVAEEYKEFSQGYDSRNIDSLCGRKEAGFELQIHQEFLKNLVHDHSDIKQMLLYHQIGSGKTISAIIIAEEHMRKHSNMKTLVILPARLKSNFINELMLLPTYITTAEATAYMSQETPKTIKANILARFLTKIATKYEIISFDRFRLDCLKSRNPREHLINLTKDKVVIIDEVHNLINHTYNINKLNSIREGHFPANKSIAGILTILFIVMTSVANATTRFVYLTATPVFDNIRQFAQLVKIMNPGANVPEKQTTINKLIPFLAGKVSYFPGSSPNAFPSVSYERHKIIPSKYHTTMLQFVRPHMFTSEEPNNSFFSLERRASIFAYIGDQNKLVADEFAPQEYSRSFEATYELALRNPARYMPKINMLVEHLTELQGKHLLYSNFIEYGADIVKAVLKHNGWTDIKDVLTGKVTNPRNYKCFTAWDGKTKDAEKDAIKALANSLDNLDGILLKVVIGSPAMKEGVSFKHIQHYHLLDPVWNQSTKTQVEGRAIRFCSHYDIPRDHAFLKRHVTVHMYTLTYEKDALELDPELLYSVDELIYDKIIPNKNTRVASAEAMLRKVAFDYYLFRKLWRRRSQNRSTPRNDSRASDYNLSENGRVFMANKEAKDKKVKTCLPKKRRPPCKEGFEVRLNKYKDECCYKVTAASERRKMK
jgi:hypothetical protein